MLRLHPREGAWCPVSWVEMRVSGWAGEQSLKVRIESGHHEFRDENTKVNCVTPQSTSQATECVTEDKITTADAYVVLTMSRCHSKCLTCVNSPSPEYTDEETEA